MRQLPVFFRGCWQSSPPLLLPLAQTGLSPSGYILRTEKDSSALEVLVTNLQLMPPRIVCTNLRTSSTGNHCCWFADTARVIGNLNISLAGEESRRHYDACFLNKVLISLFYLAFDYASVFHSSQGCAVAALGTAILIHNREQVSWISRQQDPAESGMIYERRTTYESDLRCGCGRSKCRNSDQVSTGAGKPLRSRSVTRDRRLMQMEVREDGTLECLLKFIDLAGQVLIDMRPITPAVLLIKARCVIDGSRWLRTPMMPQDVGNQPYHNIYRQSISRPVGASIFPDTC
ncbi:uncharacterized protein F5147DRAFT_817236 [Suillus discolor]|uniref:Uncharacterized protein n=1 Tax=Suillus discolor TaxID=1912936 RepID=A0A9P7EY26_9AGAM|nr:uncharacterized protein F5147DRAFT_817236 [Suillus discolor]KAG2096519.1 hypothetical protein F5147DRAFT_817236 [Suillus discolor]